MPKRPHPEPLASSSSGPSAAVRRRRVSASQSLADPGPLAGLRVHIINAKLSNELDEPATLHKLAERLGANVNSTVIEEADVIVTRIAALKRFQRHIDLDKTVRFELHLWIRGSSIQSLPSVHFSWNVGTI
jgi:hypothetical protein